MYDDSLLHSSGTTLLGIIYRDRAFAAPNLTSPVVASKLYVPPGRNELPLRLKRELDDIPIFRKAIRTPTGWAISPTEALPYSTLLPWIRAVGELTNFAQVTRPYSLRYSGAKAFNENGKL